MLWDQITPCAFPERRRQVLLLSSHPFSRGPQLRGTADWHRIVFLGIFWQRCKMRLLFWQPASQCQCMHISTKDLVYEHLPHSTLFTLSLFPIYPYIAYLAILGTKVCIHTICTLAMEVAPFPAVWGILVATAFSAILLSRPLQYEHFIYVQGG